MQRSTLFALLLLALFTVSPAWAVYVTGFYSSGNGLGEFPEGSITLWTFSAGANIDMTGMNGTGYAPPVGNGGGFKYNLDNQGDLDYIPQTTVHIWGLGYHVLVLKLWQYDIRGVPFTVATKTVYITLVPPIPAAPTLSVGSTGGPYNHPVLSWNDIGYYSVHQNTTNGYEIYRRDYEGQTLRIDWRKIASVSGTSTTWTDASLHGAPMGLDRVDYEVHAVDIANQVSPFSNVCTTKVFIYRKISPGSVPNQFALKQAYPNPFNPSTHLQFDLPGPGNVSLQILDVQGREIQTLHSGFAEVGSYDVTWNASNQATGIYFARLVVTGQLGKVLYSKTNKLLLAK